TGAFFECFHKNRDSWDPENIDSRTVEGTDKAIYQEIIDKYGEDSDEARVEVYGQFPSVGDNQFIGLAVAEAAIERPRYNDATAPTIIGVDVARFGSDKTVIWVRKGRDRLAVKKYSGLDTMQVVGAVIEAIEEHNPDLSIIDEGGLGAGVLDRLVEQRYKVRGVNFGSRADDIAWGNKRSEMWGLMRDWLKGASIGSGSKHDDRNFVDDLVGPQYKCNSNGSIMLESKDSMKRRGVASPDEADALAITFAYPVARKRNAVSPTVSRNLTYRDVSKPFGGAQSGNWMN
ncbi:MAG: terminase, partial [Minisyncoccia bacterium]